MAFNERFEASRRRVVKLYLRFAALNAIRVNIDPRALVRRDDTILEVLDLRSSHTLLLFDDQAARIDSLLRAAELGRKSVKRPAVSVASG